MARGAFSTSNYFLLSSAVVTAEPVSMSCLIYPTGLSVARDLIGIYYGGGTGTNITGFSLALGVDNIIKARKYNNSTVASGDTTATISQDTWQQVGAIYASNTSRYSVLNGVLGTHNTTSNVFSATIDKISIGSRIRHDGTPAIPLENCYISEVAFWNVALTAADMLQLSKGYSPLFVKPAYLLAYYPLIRGDSSGDIPDLIGSAKMTEIGTVPIVSHPRIFLPAKTSIGRKSTAAAYILTAAMGSFTETGQSVGLRWAHKLVATQANFVETAESVRLLHGYKLAATQINFELTGKDNNLLYGRKLMGSQVSFSLTKEPANLLWFRKIVANYSSFLLTGYNAVLTAPTRTGYTMVAIPAYFELTVFPANFLIITAWVKLTLKTRSQMLTINTRTDDLTLKDRSSSLTLEETNGRSTT